MASFSEATLSPGAPTLREAPHYQHVSSGKKSGGKKRVVARTLLLLLKFQEPLNPGRILRCSKLVEAVEASVVCGGVL
jgi:hypothetical protein